MGNRLEDAFLHQELTEIESVDEDKDKIMAKLSPKKTKLWEEIMNLNAEGVGKAYEYKRLEQELLKLRLRFESKKFLFWDSIEQADERFESVSQRGKTLAIKKDADGSLVVVEFDAPKSKLNGMGLFIMPPPEGLDGLQGLDQ